MSITIWLKVSVLEVTDHAMEHLNTGTRDGTREHAMELTFSLDHGDSGHGVSEHDA